MRLRLFAVLMLFALRAGAACQVSTDALDDMAVGELTLRGPGGDSLTVAARIADDARERAAGFQHICPGTVESTNIYFQFGSARRPAFHMHNVWAPLDIAFIDSKGVIIDIQLMKPYVLGAAEPVYYSPPAPVVAALEARAGYFGEHGVTAGEWRIERLQQ